MIENLRKYVRPTMLRCLKKSDGSGDTANEIYMVYGKIKMKNIMAAHLL